MLVMSTATALAHQPALLEETPVEEPKSTVLSDYLFQPYGEEACALAQNDPVEQATEDLFQGFIPWDEVEQSN